MIKFLARHPTAGNLLMAIFIVMGGYMALNTKRESMPDITPKRVEVRVVYPGASAEDVEDTLCRPIEDALDSVQAIEQVTAEAREGLCLLTVEMAANGDFRTFKSDVEGEGTCRNSLNVGLVGPVSESHD